MSEQVWCYIARIKKATKRWPAGTAAAVVVDEPKTQNMVRKCIADWLKDDCAIERVPLEWARQNLFTTAKYRP